MNSKSNNDSSPHHRAISGDKVTEMTDGTEASNNESRNFSHGRNSLDKKMVARLHSKKSSVFNNQALLFRDVNSISTTDQHMMTNENVKTQSQDPELDTMIANFDNLCPQDQ